MVDVDHEFEELFEAEFPAVVRSVFVVCQDVGRAEDLTQDTWIQLVDRLAAGHRSSTASSAT